MTLPVFEKSLNDFSRSYLIEGKPVNRKTQLKKEFNMLTLNLCEKLMRHERIAIKVYGENIPLALLLNLFRTKGVENLLEHDALKFVLWTPIITYNVDEISGLIPLQSGDLNSEPHSDPEKSAWMGLKWMSEPPKPRDQRKLLKKIVPSYLLPPSKIGENATKFGVEGYKSNLFESFNLPHQKDIDKLTLEERRLLCKLTTECLELIVVSNLNLQTMDLPNIAYLTNIELKKLKKTNLIEKAEEKIFEIENIPDYKKLISDGYIKVKDIPFIRNNKHSKKFREWIYTTTENNDLEEITKEYIDSITGDKSHVNKIKFLKTLGVTTTSITLGSIIGGITGGIFAAPMFNYGLNLLDTYILDGLINGWTPRHYFNFLRKQIN